MCLPGSNPSCTGSLVAVPLSPGDSRHFYLRHAACWVTDTLTRSLASDSLLVLQYSHDVITVQSTGGIRVAS